MKEPRWVGRALRSRTHSNHVTIASIERLGVRGVVSIETSTHTFFAEGIVSHNCVDNDSIVPCVREHDIAWHAPGGNAKGIGIEHAGYARQTEAEWLDVYSMACLELSAQLTADICYRYGIPAVRPSVAELQAGARGIVGHVDCSLAFKKSDHHDPGPHFPWEWYLSRVRAHLDLLTAATAIDVVGWPQVTLDGATYAVSPTYLPFVAIGQAEEIAARNLCELPSPALVDAIWAAADLKLDASKLIRQHDGTPKTMASVAMFESQSARIAELISRSDGDSFTLQAGTYKDVVKKNGVLGIYGWQRSDGTVIQPFYSKHARGWVDYSQGLRLVRRIA